MNRPRIAPLGIALALGCTATAASATVYYRDTYVTREPVQVVRVERVTAPEVVTYPDGYVTYTSVDSPRIVERRYLAPRETVVVQADPVVVTGTAYYSTYPTTHWDPRHPEWGHLIDYGLFNRQGPTDFGR